MEWYNVYNKIPLWYNLLQTHFPGGFERLLNKNKVLVCGRQSPHASAVLRMSSDGEASGNAEAAEVLQRLLAPPIVPDAAWYSLSSFTLLRAASLDPKSVLSFPSRNLPCRLLVQCLTEGTYRSQSAVLEFILATLPANKSGEKAHGRLDSKEISNALDIMTEEEDTPVLSAALALCSEQNRPDPAEEEPLPVPIEIPEESDGDDPLEDVYVNGARGGEIEEEEGTGMPEGPRAGAAARSVPFRALCGGWC